MAEMIQGKVSTMGRPSGKGGGKEKPPKTKKACLNDLVTLCRSCFRTSQHPYTCQVVTAEEKEKKEFNRDLQAFLACSTGMHESGNA